MGNLRRGAAVLLGALVLLWGYIIFGTLRGSVEAGHGAAAKASRVEEGLRELESHIARQPVPRAYDDMFPEPEYPSEAVAPERPYADEAPWEAPAANDEVNPYSE
jgi:hypothetical protein